MIGQPSETHGVARRANAILLLDKGWSCAEVSEALYLDDDTVRTWLKRYHSGGLDELVLFDWHGRSGHLSQAQEAELSAHLGERLYRDTGEIAAYIRATYGATYSHSGCIKLLHRLGFEYKRPESLPAQADEAKQAAFIETCETLLRGLAMSSYGYEAKFKDAAPDDRLGAQSGLSRVNVRFPADYVRFTPASGRSRRCRERSGRDPNRNNNQGHDKCLATVSRNVGTEIGFGM